MNQPNKEGRIRSVVYNYSNRVDEGRPYPRTFYPSVADAEHAKRIHVDEGEKVSDIIVRVKSSPDQ